MLCFNCCCTYHINISRYPLCNTILSGTVEVVRVSRQEIWNPTASIHNYAHPLVGSLVECQIRKGDDSFGQSCCLITRIITYAFIRSWTDHARALKWAMRITDRSIVKSSPITPHVKYVWSIGKSHAILRRDISADLAVDILNSTISRVHLLIYTLWKW